LRLSYIVHRALLVLSTEAYRGNWHLTSANARGDGGGGDEMAIVGKTFKVV